MTTSRAKRRRTSCYVDAVKRCLKRLRTLHTYAGTRVYTHNAAGVSTELVLEECGVMFCRIARAMDVILKISALDELSHVVREDLLRAVVFDELLDRDANAARVLDRQRLLFEGHASGGISATSSFQFAEKAATTIESSISQMWSSSDGVCLKGSVLLGARDISSDDG